MNKVKIFLVDDHPLVIEGYESLFNNEYDIVGKSYDGKGVLKWFDENDCDVILLDIKMPFLSGLDVLKYLQEANKKAKCIIISSFAEPRIVDTVIAYGGKGFIHKSESSKCVLEAVESVASGKTYFSESIRELMLDEEFENPKTTLISEILNLRELQVCRFILDDRGDEEIEDVLHISNSTYRTHKQNIKVKLKAPNFNQLILKLAKYRDQIFFITS